MCFSNPKNPKIQKSKTPKIQSSREIVRRTLDFWIFGFFGLEKHIQEDKYLPNYCAIRKKAPKSAKSAKKCNKCKKVQKVQKTATSAKRAKRTEQSTKEHTKHKKSTKKSTTNAQEAQKAQRSGQGKHGRAQCLENLGHVDVGPLRLEVCPLGGERPYIYIYIYKYGYGTPPPHGSILVLLFSFFCQVSSSAGRFRLGPAGFRASREVPMFVL